MKTIQLTEAELRHFRWSTEDDIAEQKRILDLNPSAPGGEYSDMVKARVKMLERLLKKIKATQKAEAPQWRIERYKGHNPSINTDGDSSFIGKIYEGNRIVYDGPFSFHSLKEWAATRLVDAVNSTPIIEKEEK